MPPLRHIYFTSMVVGLAITGIIFPFPFIWSPPKGNGVEILSLMSELGGRAQHYADPTQITLKFVEYGVEEPLPLFRCGPEPSYFDTGLTELVLLRGASYTKDQWVNSGILEMLCILNKAAGKPLSVSALDLPLKYGGEGLSKAFDALTSERLLSGRPAIFITPSASGISIINLGQIGGNSTELVRIVKAWIPVATKYVLFADPEELEQFKEAKIPVLAITGYEDDSNGRKVGRILKDSVGAKSVQLAGGHKAHLESPYDFVVEVLQFLDENGF